MLPLVFVLLEKVRMLALGAAHTIFYAVKLLCLTKKGRLYLLYTLPRDVHRTVPDRQPSWQELRLCTPWCAPWVLLPHADSIHAASTGSMAGPVTSITRRFFVPSQDASAHLLHPEGSFQPTHPFSSATCHPPPVTQVPAWKDAGSRLLKDKAGQASPYRARSQFTEMAVPLVPWWFRSWKRPASASCVQTHWLKALQLLGWRPSSHLRAEHRWLENYTPVCDTAAPHSVFTHRLSDTLQSWGKAKACT